MAYKSSKSKSTDPIEPPCRKTIYQTKQEAEDMIRYLNETRTTREINAYLCPTCGFWHLTSKT